MIENGSDLMTARMERGFYVREEFARASGVTRQTLYEIETGRRKASLETIVLVADALELQPRQLEALARRPLPVGVAYPSVEDVRRRRLTGAGAAA